MCLEGLILMQTVTGLQGAASFPDHHCWHIISHPDLHTQFRNIVTNGAPYAGASTGDGVGSETSSTPSDTNN